MKRISTLFVLLGLGCGGASVAQSPASVSSGAGPGSTTLAAPFTAEAIRCAHEQGERLDYAVESPGKTDKYRDVMTTEFLSVDADGAELESNTMDFTGHLTAKAERTRVTWVSLRDRSIFPAARTTTREESTTVPAGTFACKVYEVREENGTTHTYWFATSAPGLLVRIQSKRGDALVEERQLTRRLRGSAGAPAGCPPITKTP